MLIQPQTEGFYIWADFSLSGLWERSYWVFDVEATGIDAANEQVTQIGGVEVIAGEINRSSVLSSHVRSQKPIPNKIQMLTGITPQDIEAAPPFAAVFERFLHHCCDHALVTQCGYEFDYPILEAECGRSRIVFPDLPRLDTKAVFAFLHPELDSIFSTDFLLHYYSIDAEEFKRHDALGDALIIANIWCAELQEAKARGVEAISITTPIAIRRFVLPPL